MSKDNLRLCGMMASICQPGQGVAIRPATADIEPSPTWIDMMTRPFRWPFAPRKCRPPVRGATIEAIYGMIVAQARLPAFYLRFGVPDTVNGRFDMVVLHLWMVLGRLRAGGARAEAQQLFDRFCNDMDANLREMGVGDLT